MSNLPVSSRTPGPPRVVATCADVRAAVAAARRAHARLGLVPTMGALHAGHLSLVRRCREQCDFTVVTIFVNPTQFGPREDLHKYPRTWEADIDALARCGVDLVFAPSSDEMYPPGFSTFVEPPEVASPLEGQFRPGHFRGVATVVLKLFQLVPADVALFGQKDYQQCLVVRRMAEDLHVPIEIRVCPIVRESDGLAMSSRNRYLSPEERERATALSRSLQLAQDRVRAGQRKTAAIVDEMKQVLVSAGISRIDYVAIADPDTLALRDEVNPPAVALVAAHVGGTRLIDNCLLG